jgi:glucokinase
LIEIEQAEEEYAADLLERAGGRADQLTAKMVAQAAGDGNEIAREVLAHACQALGWAVAQAITLLSPSVIVIGGGVALIDETLFLEPIRREVRRYVFPPLAGTYQIMPAELGELVVVHGALAIARG